MKVFTIALAAFFSLEAQLSKDFQDYPVNGKAIQRVIRERMAQESDPLVAEKMALAADFKNATVQEISLEDARNVLMRHEYLGTLGGAEHAYSLSSPVPCSLEDLA